jgi:hypothetical protein
LAGGNRWTGSELVAAGRLATVTSSPTVPDFHSRSIERDLLFEVAREF